MAVLLCVAVSLAGAAKSFADATQSLAQRILAEAPKKWDEWDRFTRKCQGTITEKWSRKTEPWIDTYRFNGTGSFFRLNIDHGQGSTKSYETVDCINPRYAFDIRKDAANSPWMLDKFGDDDLVKPIIECSRSLYPERSVFLQSFSDVMANSTFHLLRVETLAGQQAPQARVHFECKVHDRYDLLGGWVDLDPSRCWAITEFNVRIRYFDGATKETHGLTEYGGTLGGFPVPVRTVVEDRLASSGPFAVKRTVRYDDYRLGDIAEADCRLPAFGISEPIAPRTLRFVMLGVNIVVIAALLIMAFFVIRRRRRRAPA